VALKERAERAEQLASEMSAKAQTELALREKGPAEAAVAPAPGGPGPATLPSRVYFHIRDEQQRPGAEQLKRRLEQREPGLRVPGIERIDVGPTRSSEMRFFHDGEREEAARIAQVLRDEGVGDLAVKKIGGYEGSTKIRPRHFELWLKSDAAEPP
jgi:hypothetical protein